MFAYLEPTKKTEYANKYLKKAIEQDFQDVNSLITTECFKEADKELKKGFVDKYLKKAIEQDFQDVNSLITTECFKEADKELKKGFVDKYLKKATEQEDVGSRYNNRMFQRS